MNISLILVIIAIVWLIVLSILLIWIIFVFKDLIKISKNKEFNDNSKEIVYLKSEVLKIKNISSRGSTAILVLAVEF